MTDKCPCGGKRSASWHYHRNMSVCEPARVRKNAVKRAWGAARAKPKPVEVQGDCACGGKKKTSWHRYRNIKPCLAAKEHRREQESKNERRRVNGISVTWIPGTSILVPEIDPL